MYNINAIRPFLTRHNPAADPGDFFQGVPANRHEAGLMQDGYLFHATRLRNLIGIMTDGLLASRGGVGGAGALLAEGIFVNDAGWVFASAFPEVVDCYTHEYDTHADWGEWENAPILLRFQEQAGDNFEPDPQHENAVRTHNNIAPERLEMLTPDGWVPCTGDIRNNIIDILCEMGLEL